MFRSFLDKFKNSSSLKHFKDPVCGMEAAEEISLSYKGKTYFFCSDHCRQQFEKDSERYAV